MNWNVVPGHAAARPAHPESQPAAFLEQALRTTLTAAPPSPLGPPGTSQEACVFLGHAEPAPRPLVSVRSYKATQRLLPLPDMPGEIVVASQTSVGRVTYAGVKGPRPLPHGFQAAPTLAQSIWPSVPGTCPMLAPSGAPQAGFGAGASSTRGLQAGQYPSSDGYSVPLQMAAPGPGRAPGTCPGTPRCQPSLPPPGNWTQQLASSGPSCAERRPLPQQCGYSSRGFLRDPAAQGHSPAAQGHDPGPPPPPPARNCHPLGPAPIYEPKPLAPAASYPCPPPPAGKRPPPPYECSFSRPPPPGPPPGPLPAASHAALDGPQDQERPPEPRRAFGPDLQPPWRDVAEAAGGLGGLRGLEAPADPGRPEKGADACSPPAAQVLDASATKEKLVRDIKTLVEIKRKFSELARKIKINKDLLLAAGCIKAGGASGQEPAQRPGPALGKPGPGPGPGPWVAPGPAGPPTPPAAVDSGPHGGGWSGLEALFRLSPEKPPLPALLPRQDSPQGPGPLRPAAGPLPPAAALGGLCPSGSPGGAERHTPAGVAVAPAAPHAPAACLEDPVARPRHKHPLEYPLILSLLEAGNPAAQPGAPQGAGQALPADPGAQLAGHGGPRAAAAQPPCGVAATLPAEARSPLRGASGRAGVAGQGGRCSAEVLATCLSLWKKLPAEQKPLPGAARLADADRPGAFPAPGLPETKTAPGAPAAAPFPAAQSHEPPSAPAARAPEPQIAVVSPLVLSDVRALPAKEEPPGPPPEALYPTIEEGSVCSLQSPLVAELQDAAALKGAEAVAPGPTTDAAAKPEPEPAPPAPPAPGPGEALRIGSICSLVEGDVAYDWQIARIFSSSPRRPSQPRHPAAGRGQLEGADPGLRKDGFEADTGVSAEAPGPAPPPRPPGAPSQPAHVDAGGQAEGGLGRTAGDAAPGRQPRPSAAPQQLGHPPDTRAAGRDAAQSPAGSGAPGESSPAPLLHDQLAALLREFPYGIEAGGACSGPGGQKAAGQAGDPGDPAGQIRITVLSAEQMKALFPEQDDPPPGPDEAPEPLPETPASGEGDPGAPQAPSGHGVGPVPGPIPDLDPDPVPGPIPDPDLDPDPVPDLSPDPDLDLDPDPIPSLDPDPDPDLDPAAVDARKDDVGCCALGWLSAVYTGLALPQCQCQFSGLPAPGTAARGSPEAAEARAPAAGAAERVPPAEPRGQAGPPPEAPPVPADRKAAPPAGAPGRPAQERPKVKPVDAWRPEPKASGRVKGDRKRDGAKSHRASKKRPLPEADRAARASQEKRPAALAPPLGQARGAPARDAKDPQVRPPDPAAPQVLGRPRAWMAATGGPDPRLWHKRKPDEAASQGPGLKRRKQELAQRPGGGPARPGPPAPSEHSGAKDEPGPSVRPPGPGAGPAQGSRPVPPDGVQRPRHKDAAGPKASKLVASRLWDPQAMRPGKLAPWLGGGGKPPARDPPSGGPGKQPRAPPPAEPEASAAKSAKGARGGRPPDGVWTDKSKVDRAGGAGAGAGATPAAPGQAPARPRDAMKRYLNRVAFRCEREGISLTRLDGSPRKLGRDRERPDAATARGVLEFKLCPEGMIRGAGPALPLRDPEPRPQKEQAPVQGSGIRSTKEDWLRCASEEGRAPGASEDTARSAPAHPRLSKRSLSADGFDAAQTPARGSKAMFQTYKKMYLEKRSRSLGSSPVK